MNTNQTLNFAIGLLCGGLVGAATVVLMAPQAGTDTRKSIRDKIDQIIDSGKQATIDRRRELEQEYQARIQIPLPPEPPQTA